MTADGIFLPASLRLLKWTCRLRVRVAASKSSNLDYGIEGGIHAGVARASGLLMDTPVQLKNQFANMRATQHRRAAWSGIKPPTKRITCRMRRCNMASSQRADTG
jgi:hypothetical protein